ncbi:MAG: superoxide dismutase family protein [Burkholderiales bacterium]
MAQLRSSTSAGVGTARVFDARNGVTIQVFVSNMIPGTYRVALHERGNCSSANMYSAGPAWAPPGWTKAPGELLPPFSANMEGSEAGYVARIDGVSTDGPTSIRGRSVVIHWGNIVGEAFPGQPNNRVLCGVLEPATALRF